MLHKARIFAACQPVWTRLVAALLVFSAGGPLFAANPRSTTLRDIIDNIRRNEALYDNFEMRCEVRVVPTDERHSDWSAKYRVIFQQGRHYVWKEETRSWGQDVHELAFDGIATRERRSKSEPRLNAGRQNLHRSEFAPFAARPHMILWLAGTPAYLNAGAELSTYFEGQKAVDEATGTPRFHILRLESSYVGDEEYDGLLCHHVRLRRVPVRGGGSVIVRDFWIAPDRNFLPIRVAFMETEPGDDGAVPLSTVGLFKDLREIAPGVWYPGEVHWKWQSEITADDRITEPDTVVHHQYRARVTEINHNPDYPAEFFRAIEIPSRSFVAEEEIPAETVAEPVSAETDEIAETSPWWKWPPLYMVSLVAIGIAASCVQRARRRGLQNRKPANPG